MLKRLAAGIAVAFALMAQTPAHLDTTALEAYFRHLLVWPESVKVTLGTPEPISLPGFYKLNVEGTLGDKTQKNTFYVSADSKTVIRGDVFNVKDNPFQADLDLLKTDNQPVLGVPGAPVKVVEFADFQCPYCKQEADVLRTDLLNAFPNDVQLVYVNYPLDRLHPFARGAAVMGRCIYDQNNDSFWAYHDWVFAHQSELSADNLRDNALGFALADKRLDIEKLTACALSGTQPRVEVDQTVAMGDALKIDATPTMFINGRRLVGTIGLDDLKMVVQQEIAWTKSQKKNDCCSVQLSLPGMK